MKSPLIALLAIALATPVISIPTTSDAQVLVGRGGGRSAARRAAPRPRLSPAEQDSLYEAQDLVVQLDAEIVELRRLGEEQGALTDQQRTTIESHTTRRTEAQATVDRLIAKRGY